MKNVMDFADISRKIKIAAKNLKLKLKVDKKLLIFSVTIRKHGKKRIRNMRH